MQKSLLEKSVFVSLKSNKNFLGPFLTFLSGVLFFFLKKFSISDNRQWRKLPSM